MMPEQSKQPLESGNTEAVPDGEKNIFSPLIEYGKIFIITLLAALILKLFVVDAYRIPSTSMENTLQVGDFLLVNKLAYGLHTPRHLPFRTTSLSSFTLPFFRSVHRGDVVVFEFPGSINEVTPSESVNYIKRCIGLPGDTVELRSGRVFVNDHEMHFPPMGRRTAHPLDNTNRQPSAIFPSGSMYTDVNYGPVVVPKRNDILHLDPAALVQWRVFIEREGHTVQMKSDSIMIDGAAVSSYRVQRDYYFALGDNRDNSLDSRYWGFVPDDHVIGEALMIYWSWDPEIPVTSLSEKYSTIRWDRIGTLIR
ncbi:MAG: signal peptidase I [Ignavibacteriae bacterium]|nr:MAG: signal peptidase I [Ignavibacteriota bacterium]